MTNGIHLRRIRRKNERGASAIEYAGLIVLAAIILGAITAVIPNPLSTGLKSALCTILHAGDKTQCKQPQSAKPKCTAFCPGPGHPIHPSDPVTAATKGNYVALGDSYSSGEGSNSEGGNYFNPNDKPYLSDKRGNSTKDNCHRSSNAYSQGLSKQYQFKQGTSFAACSGATTWSLYHGRFGEKPQLGKAGNPQLNQHTSAVTISVGGNDIGFADTIEACMKDPHLEKVSRRPPTDGGQSPSPTVTQSQCLQQKPMIQRKMNDLFRPRPEYHGLSKYQKVLSDIHNQAPNARIMVVGYPHLFPDPPKRSYDLVDKTDQKFLNGQGRQLDNTIAQQVQQMDQRVYGGRKSMGSFEYVDNWNGLQGHEITSQHPWINGPELCLERIVHRNLANCTGDVAGTGSFHPTIEGQASFQRNVARQLQDGPGRVLYDP